MCTCVYVYVYIPGEAMAIRLILYKLYVLMYAVKSGSVCKNKVGQVKT